MIFPVEFEFDGEFVGLLLLAELQTQEHTLRFILNDEGKFTDINSNVWLGSKLISMGDVEFSTGGDAPSSQIVLSLGSDPDAIDVVSEVQQYGVDAVRHRPCNIYVQYLGEIEERYSAIHEPILITSREMYNIRYNFDGPQTRQISITMEGPFNLRSQPINGRYTDEDHRRRSGTGDPSLEFMPVNNFTDVFLGAL